MCRASSSRCYDRFVCVVQCNSITFAGSRRAPAPAPSPSLRRHRLHQRLCQLQQLLVAAGGAHHPQTQGAALHPRNGQADLRRAGGEGRAAGSAGWASRPGPSQRSVHPHAPPPLLLAWGKPDSPATHVSEMRRRLNSSSCSGGVASSGARPGAEGSTSTPAPPSRRARWARAAARAAAAASNSWAVTRDAMSKRSRMPGPKGGSCWVTHRPCCCQIS